MHVERNGRARPVFKIPEDVQYEVKKRKYVRKVQRKQARLASLQSELERTREKIFVYQNYI